MVVFEILLMERKDRWWDYNVIKLCANMHARNINLAYYNLIKTQGSLRFTQTSFFANVAISNWFFFFRPTLFSFGYDYYVHVPTRMVGSQLNHQIIL